MDISAEIKLLNAQDSVQAADWLQNPCRRCLVNWDRGSAVHKTSASCFTGWLNRSPTSFFTWHFHKVVLLLHHKLNFNSLLEFSFEMKSCRYYLFLYFPFLISPAPPTEFLNYVCVLLDLLNLRLAVLNKLSPQWADYRWSLENQYFICNNPKVFFSQGKENVNSSQNTI